MIYWLGLLPYFLSGRIRVLAVLAGLSGAAATAYGGYKTYRQVKPLYSEQGSRGSAGGYEALGDVDDAEVSARKFSYSAPQGGGGVTSSIVINGKTVDFGHGGRHLEGTGLNVDMVNKTLANEISKIHPGTGQFYKGQGLSTVLQLNTRLMA